MHNVKRKRSVVHVGCGMTKLFEVAVYKVVAALDRLGLSTRDCHIWFSPIHSLRDT